MNSKGALIKLVLFTLLLYSVVCFAKASDELYAARRYEARLSAELSECRAENRRLKARAERGIDDDALRSLAWKRLALVKPGDILFYFD